MKVYRQYSKFLDRNRDREYHEIKDDHGCNLVRNPMTRREQLLHDIEFYSNYEAKSDWHKARIKRKLAQALRAFAEMNSHR